MSKHLRKKVVSLVLAWLVAGWSLISCNEKTGKTISQADTPQSGAIKISVDESFKPVIEQQIAVFEGNYPDSKINAEYKSEADCLKDLFYDSSTRLVITTRGLTFKEARAFQDTLHYVPRSEKIATDAIAVVTNISSSDSVFTLAGLQQLLTGNANSGKKVVFDGLSGTSSVRFVMDSILKGKPFDNQKVQAVKTSQEVLNYIATDTNAIGFVGISWIGNPEDTSQLRMLKKVKISYLECIVCKDAPYVKPTQAGIMSRRYPLVRGLYYILKENYSGLGSGFASFLQYERGQLVFRRSYLWPAIISFKIRNVHLNENMKKE